MAVKSTFIIGAVVIAVLVVKEMGPLVIDFRANSNDISNIGNLMSNTVGGCLSIDSYLNRRHLTIRSDDIIYETNSKPSSSSRSDEEERRRQCVIQTRLPLRQYNKEDVVRCIDSLWVKKHREPVYIAFVGDSTARQHFSSLIRVSLLFACHLLYLSISYAMCL
jgi:hypothetical protein